MPYILVLLTIDFVDRCKVCGDGYGIEQDKGVGVYGS